MLTIGIIREGKNPPDQRTPLSPAQCRQIQQTFPHVRFLVQPSPVRCFSDEEYEAAGLTPSEDLRQCDLLLGIKEVPIAMLIAQKTYLFFSHTIKKQIYNRALLQAILAKQIRMIDYETLTDERGERLIAFGYYAGLVGAYNALWTYAKRYGIAELRRAYQCFDEKALFEELKKLSLPPVRITITGGGRVAQVAMALLAQAGIRKVSVSEYLSPAYPQEPVYVQLRSADYHAHRNGKPFESAEFYQSPQNFVSTFDRYFAHTDILIACAYWSPQAPPLFSKAQMRQADFRIKIVADVTCDVNGSVPCTLQTSKIAEPVYDYCPQREQVESPFSAPEHISVMAIDNLPSELPRTASEYFGKVLVEKILPHLLEGDKEQIIQRATIAEGGKLTPRFAYLEDFVSEKPEKESNTYTLS